MTIIFYDGSTLTCGEIEVCMDGLLADGYRLIPDREVLRITD